MGFWSLLSLPIKMAIAVSRVNLCFLIAKTENIMTDHKSNKHETESLPKWTRFDYGTHSPVETETNAYRYNIFLFWKMDLDMQGYAFFTQ